ncbi:assimilatory sulfite reductase (NADPH) flavoprotein subunit [Alteromonadaceae bacterium M269]|nr:assimilatory sulfite reductase (NADPH) flavoprotein subunit [Alteromonadaceae bacterium M269]
MASSNTPSYSPASMLNEAQWLQLNQAVSQLNPSQLTWVSGYLAGLAQAQAPAAVLTSVEPQSSAEPSAKMTILYGSQTGNAKGVAENFKNHAEAAGLNVQLMNMADFKPKSIKNETHVAIVVSTHGEGDPPDDAIELHEFLGSKKAPKLDALKYSVIGLGDTSYEFFCQTAKDFDQKLSALGAKAVTELVSCDVDYDEAAEGWIASVTSKLKDELSKSSQVVAMPGVTLKESAPIVHEYTKKNPYTATLGEQIKITGRDSVKDIRHVEISLEDSGIQYSPGDALGLWFTNDPALVDEILTILELDGDDAVNLAGDSMALKAALVEKLELTQSYPNFVKSYGENSQDEKLKALLATPADLRDYLADRQIVDVIRDFPVKIEAQQLVDALRPISPRLYSIASSQAEVEEEVHLTVAVVEYDAFGQKHLGGASGFLAERLEEEQEVRVYIENNDNFRLPADPNTPVIMVGPGTGIAPFRAFMQERDAQEAEGKNWLFFGNPSFTQDFLYQVEWQRFVKDGVLDKISLAFSRDQEHKIYVQHRLLEQGAEVYQWLEEGAHFYVCGDANQMAKDVHEALISIVEKHGGKNREDAEKYITDLRRAKRYQKDVY